MYETPFLHYLQFTVYYLLLLLYTFYNCGKINYKPHCVVHCLIKKLYYYLLFNKNSIKKLYFSLYLHFNCLFFY